MIVLILKCKLQNTKDSAPIRKNRSGATCVLSGDAFPRIQGVREKQAIRSRLMAIVAEGPNGRLYLPQV